MRLVLVALLVSFSTFTFAQSEPQTQNLAPSQQNRNDEVNSKVEGLATQAKALSGVGNHIQALSIQLRLLDILEKSLGPNHLDVTKALHDVAITYFRLAQYERALPVQLRVVATLENVFGPEHPSTARSLGNLALIYSQLEQFDKAIPLQLRVIAINEKVLGADHADTAMALTHLASTYSQLTQYDKELPLQLRALAINEKVLGADHADIAMALTHLASTYSQLAQYDKALPLLRRALVIREKTIGPEHPDLVKTLIKLADNYDYLAQYNQALPLLQRTLTIQEKAYGPEHPDVAMTLGNLANTYNHLGQYDQALSLHHRALVIREKISGPEHPDMAMILNNLAITYSNLGQHEQALTLFLRALTIREKTIGPEHPDLAHTLINLGVTYDYLAQYNQALPLLQRALTIQEKTVGPEHPDVATALSNLAVTHMHLDQYEQALPLFLRALAIREKTLGPEHPSTGKSYLGLGMFYTKQSLPDLAITFYKLAVNILQSNRERTRRIGIVELESYTRSVERVYQDLAAVLAEQGRLAEAQEVLELLKADELFEYIRRSETKDLVRNKIKPKPSEDVLVTRYRTIADRLFAFGQEEKNLEKIPTGELTTIQRQRLLQVKADLRVAHQAFTYFMGELKKEAKASETERSANLKQLSQTSQSETLEILQALGDGVALVQYFVTDTELNMLVTTARLQKHYKSRISAQDLNRKLYNFRVLIGDEKRRGNPQTLAEELYQLLFAPMEADLAQAGIRTVMIGADGALRYIPFAALHDGKDYLIARYALPTYTSVTRKNLNESANSVWVGVGLGVTQAHADFKALPAVRDELYSIMGPTIPGEIYLDQAFTAKRLQAVGRQRLPVVHIASHFTFSPGTELNSFLLLGDGQTLSVGSFREGDYQLNGVDLLTLSACQTGLGFGRDEKGREIEGFGVIAQQKGAKAVVATLWPVADSSTSKLMAEVYRNRQTGGLTKIEALRQAQLSLQKQARYAHPFFWAPFILMGNWK
jgi:CHAT domain-containing protein